MSQKKLKKQQKLQKHKDSTSKILIKKRGSVWVVLLPIEPVPASRPRVTRNRHVYYPKRYTAFRKRSSELLGDCEMPPEFPLSGLLAVSTEFVIPRPKTTKRMSPRGDVDNYFKTLDVLNEIVWMDDDQIAWASMSKEFGDHPGIRVEVKQIERIPKTRTLSKLQF